MEQGWIKIHRKMVEWEWYTDDTVFRVFLHLLLSVNYERKKWKGVWIEKGQIITSYGHLGEELNLGVQSIRTALTKLKSTGELTIKTSNKYTVITVLKWNDYQTLTSKLTNEQQTTNKQLTTTKELKEYKEDSTFTKVKDAPIKKMKNTWKYNEKNSSDTFEDSIDIETGELSKPKVPQRQKAINYIKDYFSLKCEKELKIKPVLTYKQNIIIANLFNKNKMKPSEITAVIDWWFNTEQDQGKLIHLGFCLNATTINNYKVSQKL